MIFNSRLTELKCLQWIPAFAGMTKRKPPIRAIRLLFVCFVIQCFFGFGCGYAALCSSVARSFSFSLRVPSCPFVDRFCRSHDQWIPACAGMTSRVAGGIRGGHSAVARSNNCLPRDPSGVISFLFLSVISVVPSLFPSLLCVLCGFAVQFPSGRARGPAPTDAICVDPRPSQGRSLRSSAVSFLSCFSPMSQW